MRVQTLIVFLLGLGTVLGYTQPEGALVNRYEEKDGDLCGFYLKGVKHLKEDSLKIILDSICRSEGCGFCTFHNERYIAMNPAYKDANDYYIGAYDVKTQTYLLPEKSLFSMIPIYVWGILILVIVLFFAFRYT